MQIKINGKEYKLKEITFKSLRELEKLGFNIVTLQNIEENYWSALSSLSAYVMDCTLEQADNEIEQHLENGGKLDDFTPLIEMIVKSDFFTKLSKQQTK